jgi:hypothetical protein
MSLKIEQKIAGFQFADNEPRIYSTGVYLVPLKVSVNGNSRWVWVAEEFDNDTYLDGDLIDPNIMANKLDKVIKKD